MKFVDLIYLTHASPSTSTYGASVYLRMLKNGEKSLIGELLCLYDRYNLSDEHCPISTISDIRLNIF
jgi:hypothetical protein